MKAAVFRDFKLLRESALVQTVHSKGLEYLRDALQGEGFEVGAVLPAKFTGNRPHSQEGGFELRDNASGVTLWVSATLGYSFTMDAVGLQHIWRVEMPPLDTGPVVRRKIQTETLGAHLRTPDELNALDPGGVFELFQAVLKTAELHATQGKAHAFAARLVYTLAP